MRHAILLVVLSLALTAPANAQTASRKTLRGFAAVTTAFLEVPGNMVAESRKHGPGEGLPVGFALGLGMIVPRVLVGAWEILSAPFPVPAHYRPLLQPEYPWSYFDADHAQERRRQT